MKQPSILITGCSSGIGYDAAHGMRDAGWHVFASCRKQSDCDKMRSEGFDSPLIDYEDFKTIASGLSEVLAETNGRLDALFNNGAYALPGAVEDIPTDGLRAIFEANFFGWHELTKAVLPVMRAQGSGRIVQNSSVFGLVAGQWRGAYTASKYAIEGLTDTLRIEMRGTNIHVILIEPGPIATPIRQNSIPHFEKWIDWPSSPRAAQYEAHLIDRLYKSNGTTPFELQPSAVTEKLLHAVTSERPRPRYYVTRPTYIMGALKRLLSTRALDRILSKG